LELNSNLNKQYSRKNNEKDMNKFIIKTEFEVDAETPEQAMQCASEYFSTANQLKFEVWDADNAIIAQNIEIHKRCDYTCKVYQMLRQIVKEFFDGGIINLPDYREDVQKVLDIIEKTDESNSCENINQTMLKAVRASIQMMFEVTGKSLEALDDIVDTVARMKVTVDIPMEEFWKIKQELIDQYNLGREYRIVWDTLVQAENKNAAMRKGIMELFQQLKNRHLYNLEIRSDYDDSDYKAYFNITEDMFIELLTTKESEIL
jgi:hypothetical protein